MLYYNSKAKMGLFTMSSSYAYYGAEKSRDDFVSYDKKGRLTLKLDSGIEYFTKREMEILQYVLQGYSAKRIGQLLGISFRTVESYINTLKIKFRCNRKNDLISLCIRLGIIRVSFEAS